MTTLTVEQLNEINVNKRKIFLEPSTKNTAPTILAAVIYALGKDPDSIILVLPTDHKFEDKGEFISCVKRQLV